MILQPSNVELTKIHYYEKHSPGSEKTISINTISQDVQDNNNHGVNKNRDVIIKKNIFGHRWVLKINEDEEVKKTSRWKLFVYVLVFLSILIVVGFGIFLTLDNTIFKKREKMIKKYIYPEDVGIRSRPTPYSINITWNQDEEDSTVTTDGEIFSLETTTAVPERRPFCTNCTFRTEVCMKLNDTSKPECVPAVDAFDPTGCGGLCQINTEFCQVLSYRDHVYQCSPRRTTLVCEDDQFSCGNMCVSMEKRCDGSIDCSNMSDEVDCVCDYTTHFHCGERTSCLPMSRRCDQVIDCWDGSDELNCYRESTCAIGEQPCNNGYCIRTDQLCDGTPDCADNSDEPEGCTIYD